MKSLWIGIFASILATSALFASVEPFDPAAELFAATETEGGCQLPDLTHLSASEIPAALEGTGIEVQPSLDAQVPTCPTVSLCSSVTNCGIRPVTCTSVLLGPCCSTGGLTVCCVVPRRIVVSTCNCACTVPSLPCPSACTTTLNVTRACV
jgi:hypothetical protein